MKTRIPVHVNREKYLCIIWYARQYPRWRRLYNEPVSIASPGLQNAPGSGYNDDNVSRQAMNKAQLSERMERVERAAKKAAPEFWKFLLDGVTEGLTFETLKARDIPCERKLYYKRRRLFYELLSYAVLGEGLSED